MQIIISSRSSGKVEADKLEVKVDKLSKAEMEAEVDKAMIFFIVDLMTNLISKSYAIIYNFEAKILLVICLYFVDDQ